MDRTRLDKLAQDLRSTTPLLGAFRRRAAARELAADAAAEVVPHLIWALGSSDGDVRATADAALRGLTDARAVDALCAEAVKDPKAAAAAICLARGFRPRDPEALALYLFVTRQLDAYFAEDFEFQNLRLAYDRATPAVQAHVMEIVRGGDRRCLGFFGARKALTECTEQEIRLALDSAERHADWARLWRAFMDLPLKYGYPLLERFRKSGWQPPTADLAAVYREVLTASDSAPLPQKAPPPESSVFTKWLTAGRTGDLARLSEADLLAKLKTATPPEGVSLVAALATKCRPGSAAAKAVMTSEHWLVRLAGHAEGLAEADLARDAVTDANYWVRELARAEAVLELWPCKATPADLEQLEAAPREAWEGKLGSVRRVLRALLAYRITTGSFDEMAIEGGEFAGEFEMA